MAIILVLSSIFLISCKNSSSSQNNQYNGYVAIERVAKHLTPNEKDQKIVIDFLSKFEEIFHIDPHVLFQNSNYLTVSIYRVDDYESLTFYFTNQEPKVRDGFLYFNGYLSYSRTHYDSDFREYTRFKSWYEGPGIYNDWSSGRGMGSDVLLKTIDLNNPSEFDWYQNPKNP